MFKLSADDRLSFWVQHRRSVENSEDPLNEVWEFWKNAPFIPYNKKIDPFYPKSWPTPWSIIVENKYDDFTKALMIAWTLKSTKRFQNLDIDIKIAVDKIRNTNYNIVCIDNTWAINYSDNGPILTKELPESVYIENIIRFDIFE